MVEMSLFKGHTNGNFLVGLPPPIKKAPHKGIPFWVFLALLAMANQQGKQNIERAVHGKE